MFITEICIKEVHETHNSNTVCQDLGYDESSSTLTTSSRVHHGYVLSTFFFIVTNMLLRLTLDSSDFSYPKTLSLTYSLQMVWSCLVKTLTNFENVWNATPNFNCKMTLHDYSKSIYGLIIGNKTVKLTIRSTCPGSLTNTHGQDDWWRLSTCFKKCSFIFNQLVISNLEPSTCIHQLKLLQHINIARLNSSHKYQSSRSSYNINGNIKY